ncbi:response regulator transcription factor [Acidothermaceae bacterium B102]|nr:response regulator transcription factor [Acidothermaceae bacterium B102]
MTLAPASTLPRVLVVDDDATVSDVLMRYLTRAGFQVAYAADGIAALAEAAANPPDLIVLDLMLPGIDGLSVCSTLRKTTQVPVIMLTALGEERDRIAGLEVGADDYVTKPFSPRELVLRVQSVLRRSVATPSPVGAEAPLVDGDLEIDTVGHHVRLRGEPIALTGREYDLLCFFLRHPGRAFSRAELLNEVWGWSFGDHSTVTVHVRRLREKLEDDPAAPTRITTVWGVGYRYEPQAPA